jgi:hypothetical protein
MSRARLFADASLSGHVVRGLRERRSHVDILATWEIGLDRWSDPEVLEWAADNGRAVVARDRKTMIGFAYRRVSACLAMPGLVVVPDRRPITRVIDDLAKIVEESDVKPLDDVVKYLPLDKTWRVSEEEPERAAAGA